MNILEAGLHIFRNNPRSLIYFPGALFAVICMFTLLNIVATLIFGGTGLMILVIIDYAFKINLTYFTREFLALAFIVSIPYTFFYLKNYEL